MVSTDRLTNVLCCLGNGGTGLVYSQVSLKAMSTNLTLPTLIINKDLTLQSFPYLSPFTPNKGLIWIHIVSHDS